MSLYKWCCLQSVKRSREMREETQTRDTIHSPHLLTWEPVILNTTAPDLESMTDTLKSLDVGRNMSVS